MEPSAYPYAPAFPMQPVRYDEGVPGQPAGSSMVQHSTVNIVTEPPRDHIIWSIICFSYANPFCLGLVALIYSIKARDRKFAGDLEGARQHSQTARCLNIIATVLGSICFLLTIITVIAVVTSASNTRYPYYYEDSSRFQYG